MRATLIRAVLLVSGSLGLHGQPAPAFEVASIKIARDSGVLPVCFVPCTGERLTVSGSRVDIRFMSLYQLIIRAYRIKPYQLSGPNWMNSQKFDIAATMPDGVSKDQIPEMLRNLLAERFKLSIHRESKEQPVYALVVSKNGSKLKASSVKAEAFVPDSPSGRTVYTPNGEAHLAENGVWQIREGPHGPVRITVGKNATSQVEFLKITMPELAEVLTPSLDRVVVDATGVKGSYQLQVDWSVPPPPPNPAAAAGPIPAPPPSLSLPSIEKSGLKLEMRKAPVDLVVVDRLEKLATSN